MGGDLTKEIEKLNKVDKRGKLKIEIEKNKFIEEIKNGLGEEIRKSLETKEELKVEVKEELKSKPPTKFNFYNVIKNIFK